MRLRWVLAGVLFVAAFCTSRWVDTQWEQQEDAYITYQYARRLAAGEGFTFSPGTKPTLGTTTPLWTFALAAFAKLGLPPHRSAPWLTSVGHGVTAAVLLLTGEALLDLWVGLAAGLAWASSLSVFFATGGMETALVVALSTLSLLGLVRRWPAWAIGVVCGLLVLARLDAALFALALLAAVGLRERSWRPAARATAIAMLLYLPWIVYSLSTFGALLPASVRAKTTVVWPSRLTLGTFIGAYLGTPQAAWVFWVWLTLATLGAVALIRRHRWLAPPLIWAPVYCLAFYLGRAPGCAWYLAAPLALGMLLLPAGMHALASRPGFRPQYLTGLAALVVCVAICGWLATQPLRPSYRWRGFRRQLAQEVKRRTAPGDLVASMEVGNLAYWSDRPVLDLLGLTCPQALPYTRSNRFADMLERYQPRLVVVVGLGDVLRDDYHPVWLTQYWAGSYVIWERKERSD